MLHQLQSTRPHIVRTAAKPNLVMMQAYVTSYSHPRGRHLADPQSRPTHAKIPLSRNDKRLVGWDCGLHKEHARCLDITRLAFLGMTCVNR